MNIYDLLLLMVISMPSNLLLFVSSNNKEKIKTALMYARNSLKYGWLDDVRVIFFGPSEKAILGDDEITEYLSELGEMGILTACKAIAEMEDISFDLSNLGIKVEYVGSVISDYIKKGYMVINW